MKYLITSLVLLIGCLNLHSQTFNFHRTSEAIVYGNDSSGLICHASVNNLTGSNNQLRLIKTTMNIPQGWEFCICDIVQCHPVGVDTAIADYPPGESMVDIIMYTHSVYGTGYLTVRAEKVSNVNEHYD